MYRLVLFDMDGTLLNGRTIFHLAEKKRFREELEDIIHSDMQPYEKTIDIACLLKGVGKKEILDCFHEISFRDYVPDVIDSLKQKGCIIALATDSYDIVADDMKKRLGLDYAFANTLKFQGGICNGEVILHNKSYVVDDVTGRIYSIAKSSILEILAKENNIPLSECIAVGDGIVDCGMLTHAGLGIAVFASAAVKKCADIHTNDLREILRYV